MEHFVGIDVAKDRLGVHLRPSGESFAVGRDGEGLARLVERLRALAPALVVLEATGGSREWWPAPLPQRSCRWRWSTHARSAILAPPANWPRPTGSTPRQSRISRPPARAIANTQAQALGELVAGRRQVIEMMVAGRNRRRTATQRRVIRAIECHLALVQAELSELGRRYRPCHPAAVRPGRPMPISCRPCPASARRRCEP
jgi:transposase